MDALSDVRFSTVIKNSNYIVRDHRVHGVRIMPGVTLLDMIYRFVQTKGIDPQQVELRRVLFREAVSTSEHYDKKIRISFKKQESGYLVIAESRKVKDGAALEDGWDENLRCELVLEPLSGAVRRSIDIPRIIRDSHRVEDMDHAYGYVRRIDIRHLEFMKGLGKLYYGDRRILAEISLGELAAQYMSQYYMHPCYLDAATLVQGFVVLQELDFNREIQASIPMFIESFRSFEAMRDKIYVYIKDEGYPDGDIRDLMYFDIEIYNGQGQEIARFKRWGLKKIRSRELIAHTDAVEAAAAAAAPAIPAAALQPHLQAAAVPSGHSLTPVAADEAPESGVSAYLRRLVSGLSGQAAADISETEGFYNLGLQSQDLLNVVKQLEEGLGVSLYPTLLFEYATIQELGRYILSEHRDSFLRLESPPQEAPVAEAKGEAGAAFTALAGYAPQWIRRPLQEADGMEKAVNVLVFCHDHDPKQWTGGPGKRYSFVHPADGFNASGSGSYGADLSCEADYVQLLDHLERSNGLPDMVVDALQAENNRVGGPEWSLQPLFYMVREMLRRKGKSRIRVIYLHGQEQGEALPGDMAMEGFLHCIQNETDKVICKSIGLDAQARSIMAELVDREAAGSWDNRRIIRYERGERLVKAYRKVGYADSGHGTGTFIRKNRSYLITGGAGGIGMNLAEHILQLGGRVILCGRALEPSDDICALQAAVGRYALEYMCCDITDLESVNRMKRSMKARHAGLDGILHCAGVTRDAYLVQKEWKQLEQVLRVKIAGTLQVDEAFKDEPLQFFAAFSSVAGILGNPGQSDYAYANLYMDGYMLQREALRQAGLRSGKSLAVNWPLWRDGGMKGDFLTEQSLSRKFGMIPLDTEDGIRALEWSLQQQESRILIAAGEEARMDAFLLDEASAVLEPEETGGASSQAARPGAGSGDDIAIIGVSGRFPGANDLFEYWELLKAGTDCITEVDAKRWSHEELQQTANESWGKSCSKWGGFLHDIDKFDALLFNVAPFQAALMDPHERIFLETAWEAFEDGGYIKSALKGRKVGVFAGAMWMQYQLYNNSRNVSTSTISSIANRVSYYFGLNGPSLGVDTMCSSSLTALHLACQSIKSGDCEMALAGGVNLSVHPDKYLLLAQGNFASSDGRCRSFGEGGDGYVPAEAAGAVLVKPLKLALRDGDRVYAVIKGSALNHGGEAGGFTVPNQKAQEDVIAEAIRRSGVNADSVTYIEAHGTGTSLGDPIEIKALINAYQPYTTGRFRCAVGSVKSNIGHAEAAAGISSLAKVILQMEHGQLVPSIHSQTVNPHIRLADSGFYIQQRLEEWKPFLSPEGVPHPRRAGISAFGAGGSNAHLILEQYNGGGSAAEPAGEGGPYLFVLSAQSGERLQAYAKRMLRFLQEHRPSGRKGSGAQAVETVRTLIAELLHIPAQRVSSDSSLGELGLGHVERIGLCHTLSDMFGIPVSASSLPEELSVQEIAYLVSEGLAGGKAETAGTDTAGPLVLSRLAYTLQCAREPMKHRLAVLFDSLDELIGQVEEYLGGRTSGRLFTGEAGRSAGLAGQEAYGFHDMEALAKAWTAGAGIPWRELYGGKVPELMSLPHYPFARKSYWIEPLEEAGSGARSADQAVSASSKARLAAVQSSGAEAGHGEYARDEADSGYDVNSGHGSYAGYQAYAGQDASLVQAAYNGDEVSLQVIDGHVALIRIQDATHNNTFTHEVIQGLTHCFHQAQNDEQIKVIVVAGNDRVFSMGGTQEQLMDISDSKLSFTDAPILYRGMLESPLPVISAMEGHASGGGMLFGLYADIVVMAEESVYSAAFAKYGFTPGMGATFILEERLGKNLATEMMFTAKMYTGEQLKNRAASVIFRRKADVLGEALYIARMIAEKPRATVSILKRELSGRMLDTLLHCVQRENEMHRITFTTPEVKERIRHLYRVSEEPGHSYSAMPQVAAAGHTEKPPAAVPPVQAPIAPVRPQAATGGRDIKPKLARIVASRIQLEETELDEHMNLKDMGVDSISGVEIVRDINEAFGINLDTIDIYDYPTIHILAGHIGDMQGGRPSGAQEEEAGTEPEVMELLSRLNEDELDVDEVARLLEVYYEER